MLDRLSKGHIGLCAIYEGKIVGFTWRSIDEIWIDEHKINLKLPPKHRYGYDGYTHPKYRRYGIFHELLTSSYPYFNEMGYPFLLSMISHDNEASLKALEKNRRKKARHNPHYKLFMVSVSFYR
jgi:ribosomal protein S18 acetylase RimI-like enzyme